MAAPSIAVSETVLLVGGTEQHFSKNVYYHTIVVDNSGDPGGTGTAGASEVYVATDGGTATAGAGGNCEMVPAGQSRVFSNLQPLPNPNVVSGAAKYYNGATTAFDQSESVGWTAQSGNAVTGCTYCSIISAGTPEVTITFE